MDIILREDTGYAPEHKQVITMETKYMEYVNEHINYVKQSYLELFFRNLEISTDSFSNEELRKAINDIKDDIMEHDNSKFSDEEFYGYRVWYYPTEGEKERMRTDEMYKGIIEEKYNKAWEHHLMNNNHHAEYWKVVDGHFQETNPPRDMELGAIIHMICDWEAMSKKFKTDTVQWYNEQYDKEEKFITVNTRHTIEELLHAVFKK